MTETRKGPGASLLRCSSVLTGCGERRQIRSLACSQGGEPICGQGCLQRAGHSEQGKLQRAHLQNVARLGLRLYNFVILKLFIIFPAKDLASGHCTGSFHASAIAHNAPVNVGVYRSLGLVTAEESTRRKEARRSTETLFKNDEMKVSGRRGTGVAQQSPSVSALRQDRAALEGVLIVPAGGAAKKPRPTPKRTLTLRGPAPQRQEVWERQGWMWPPGNEATAAWSPLPCSFRILGRCSARRSRCDEEPVCAARGRPPRLPVTRAGLTSAERTSRDQRQKNKIGRRLKKWLTFLQLLKLE
uniref:Uncharacterized protein n=1 Tax=Rangifer tarandus platyrhynchus TaxID=3082113 RepID=A0ACB0FDJ3_RANTA|nr:unnamed protein product [Rangifer tarandus platyrhynchus]